jgi:hypothetical protein
VHYLAGEFSRLHQQQAGANSTAQSVGNNTSEVATAVLNVQVTSGWEKKRVEKEPVRFFQM